LPRGRLSVRWTAHRTLRRNQFEQLAHLRGEHGMSERAWKSAPRAGALRRRSAAAPVCRDPLAMSVVVPLDPDCAGAARRVDRSVGEPCRDDDAAAEGHHGKQGDQEVGGSHRGSECRPLAAQTPEPGKRLHRVGLPPFMRLWPLAHSALRLPRGAGHLSGRLEPHLNLHRPGPVALKVSGRHQFHRSAAVEVLGFRSGRGEHQRELALPARGRAT